MSKRIIDQPTATTLSANDYVMVDHQTSGSKKFDLGTALGDIKQDLEELQEEIEGGGSGLTAEAKTLIITIMRNGLYSTDQSNNIDALEDAFFAPVPATGIILNESALSFGTLNATQQLTATVTPSDSTDTVVWSSSNTSVATVSNTGLVTSVGYGSATITATAGSVSATCSVTITQATLTSISAVYTQSGTVYDTDSLDSLKNDLVVTATWSDSSTSTVASNDYTLSGTLTEGTSTITVSYGGKTDTFTVTVTHNILPLYDWDFTQSLTDTVEGVTATLTHYGQTAMTRDSNGLAFTEYGQCCDLGTIFDYDRTIEIDFTTFNIPVITVAHVRAFMVGTANTAGNGIVINKNNRWTVYSGSWWTSGFSVPADQLYTYFANKTVKIYIDEDGYATLYANGTNLGTAELAFTGSNLHFYIGNYATATVGANFYNVTVTGVRVYEGEV